MVFELRMHQRPADGATGKERTAGCRLTGTRRMDVDVVAARVVLDGLDQGSVHILRAPSERGGMGRGAEAEEGHYDPSGDGCVDMGGEDRGGQARDGDFPAH